MKKGKKNTMPLPIAGQARDIAHQLRSHNLLLSAPPGAGKSTYLPLYLLQHLPLGGGKIVMLQPRRVAARAIAEYLAQQLGEKVGQKVGYRIRGEVKVSPETQLEIITEGVLTRWLLQNPELPGISLLIFDEFHERSLHADWGLALAIDVQQTLREDLRLLVMSATIALPQLAALIPNVKTLRCEGRSYPITYHYQPPPSQLKLEQHFVNVVLSGLQQFTGSILVFLPGKKEITRVQQGLEGKIDSKTALFPLYGQLSKSQQQQAIAPAPQGQRKVVLTTNVAETSLTIDGIAVVIDSGLQNTARYSAKRGALELRQEKISQASSIQRAGRAGRLGPGDCIRLWPQEQQDRLREYPLPDIKLTDILPFILQLAAWGESLDNMALLDHPDANAIAHAKALLNQLGALDNTQALTAKGRKMAALNCHPRFAALLLAVTTTSESEGADNRERNNNNPLASFACFLVAYLEQSRQSDSSLDLYQRLQRGLQNPEPAVLQQAKHLAKTLAVNWQTPKTVAPELATLLMQAYPDRIARKQGSRYKLSNGTGAEFFQDQGSQFGDWIVVADLISFAQASHRITLAVATTEADIRQSVPHLWQVAPRYDWHADKQKVTAQEVERCAAIVVHKKATSVKDYGAAQAVLLQQLTPKVLETLLNRDGKDDFLTRVAFAHFRDPKNWPDWSLAALQASTEQWLQPYLSQELSLSELKQLNCLSLLQQQLDYSQQQTFNQYFPSHITTPNGKRIPLRYEAQDAVLSLPLQDTFGWQSTPSIENGQFPVLLELLSPARRPIQITRDLAGFWQGSYLAVQKDMKGRYPKHHWPDKPQEAAPQRSSRKPK